MSLITTSSKIIGGSALAGFGLSFGRDVYKGTKKSIGKLLLLLIFVAALMLLYTTSVWLFRNYASLIGGFFKRLGALALFIPSYYITFGGLYAIFYLAYGWFGIELTLVPLEILALPIAEYSIEWRSYMGEFLSLVFNSVTETTTNNNDQNSIDGGKEIPGHMDQKILILVFFLQHLIIFFGVVGGVKHRTRRRTVWEAEEHNSEFLRNNGIEELDENNFRDSQGNRYRLHNIFEREIELFAEGRRNMRAYIQVDETGKFSSWSGLVSIA
jgi:hypothetical protein